jgi:hypothetical protein
LLFSFWNALSQNDSISMYGNIRSLKIAVADTIYFQDVSTNSDYIALYPISNNDSIQLETELDDSLFEIDFSRSKIVLLPDFYRQYPQTDSLEIQFKPYPNFLTQDYNGYDASKIFPNFNSREVLSFENDKAPLKGNPFDGLDTQGSLIRGITVGNNQDAVLNSSLDLKIEGKLSSKIQLNARINDTNLPIQENGYSQELKDIDRIYMELLGPKWGIKAGDIILQDSTHYFMSFTKKVQGVSLDVHTEQLNVFSSGALVKGRYVFYQFQGQEANQGPYKLQGDNGELYIFIIQDSERVYIDGVMQTRGENKDYIMDYNTGEITFTPQNPITSDMRITLEYQYSDRNYSRFVTQNAALFHTDTFSIGTAFFKESDMKNQTVELDLTAEQIELLANADSNSSMVYTFHAVETDYDDDKILYRKLVVGSTEIYEYSQDTDETLYQVGFTYFGEGLGDYVVQEYLAIGKKMQYVGENSGDYKAVIPLMAPNSVQLMVLQSNYEPNEKTFVDLECAYSINDVNLFSNSNASEVKAPAVKAMWEQTLWEQKWKTTSLIQFDFVHQNFNNLEGTYDVEFDRDWNLNETVGNQSLLNGTITFENEENGSFYYQFENLKLSDLYNGTRHNLGATLAFGKWEWNQWSSMLNSKDELFQTHFIRNESQIKFTNQKWWSQAELKIESNKLKTSDNNTFYENSFQNFHEKWSFGIGDSTQVYVKTGLHLTQNDSVRSNAFRQVNQSQTWFLQSQLIENKNTNLQFFSSYRMVQYENGSKINALNTRASFRHQVWNGLVSWQTNYQNTSGQLAQQDYTYIETEPGQGFYTWIDYNANGLKELDEFEIAQFADQAQYLRITLPHINYLPTQESKLTQNLVWNASKWSQKDGFKKFLSHWHNQLNIIAQNNKQRIDTKLHLNPFDFEDSSVLSHQLGVQNQLYFNRGKSHYTTGYHWSDSNQKLWQSFGTIQQHLTVHQLNFQHLIEGQWQINLTAEKVRNQNINEIFLNRNFKLIELNVKPGLTYYFSKKHWIKSSYEYTEKNNKISDLEHLTQQKLQFNYQFTSEKDTRFSVDFNLLKNTFEGNANSAVGYQMLEGLQPGNNMTWMLLWNKKLNSFLYFNLNYNGRAHANSRTIHNGNVQLRAQF